MTLHIDKDLVQALVKRHGLIEAEGTDGKVVVMSMAVYRQIMGVGSDEELAQSIAALNEGMADIEAGRTQPMAAVFAHLAAEFNLRD